jgi:hypothetical protein
MRSVCDDALVPVADHQTLRMLEGRYVLERTAPDVEVARDGEVLAVVRGPDGGACMRRQDAAGDAWAALWNGDEAHPPDATGMLAAIVAPLAAGNVVRAENLCYQVILVNHASGAGRTAGSGSGLGR